MIFISNIAVSGALSGLLSAGKDKNGLNNSAIDRNDGATVLQERDNAKKQ